MKVFNLACSHGHEFEGWFGSANDFDAQLANGLLECPLCADRKVRKLLSAPRLNLSGAEPPRSASAGTQDSAPPAPSEPARELTGEARPSPQALQAMFLKMARFLMRNTEDVGDRFADEARRIHHRESPERGIRGTATREQASELAEEGIEVFSLPLPAALKEPLQ